MAEKKPSRVDQILEASKAADEAVWTFDGMLDDAEYERGGVAIRVKVVDGLAFLAISDGKKSVEFLKCDADNLLDGLKHLLE